MDHNAKKKFVKTFNSKKRDHSHNVHSLVQHLSDDPDVEQAALFHDFLEHGGKEKDLIGIISPTAIELVKALTNKSNDSVLQKIKKELKVIPVELRDKAIKIKLADRADNFQKRKTENILTDKYIDKTIKLVKFLYNTHSTPDLIKNFIAINFSAHPELKKIRV